MAEVPLALALVAGAVATVNPCGFALLPAYLSVLVADPHRAPGGTDNPAAMVRAVRFALGMTLGFVAVFGLFGVAVAPLALSIERWLPFVTVAIGVALVAFGAWTLAGRRVGVPGLAGRGSGPTTAWTSQIGYGVTFALASLSCTVAPFLAVTAGALRGGSVPGVVAAFLAYALGMGIVVLGLSLAVATAHGSMIRWLRRAGPAVSRLGGVLAMIAGAYVAWYGGYELRVLSGAATEDPVVGAATAVQAELSRAVTAVGATGIVVLAVLLAAALVLLIRRRTRTASTGPPVGAGRDGR